MRFEDVPVEGMWRVNDTVYRKENTFGKSRMLCNATIVPEGANPKHVNRDYIWVFVELDAQVPYPNHHIAQVTSMVNTMIFGGRGKIVDMRQKGASEGFEIQYAVQSLEDDEPDDEPVWYSAHCLQRMGVEIPFLPPIDNRPDWQKNLADRKGAEPPAPPSKLRRGAPTKEDEEEIATIVKGALAELIVEEKGTGDDSERIDGDAGNT